MAPSIVGINVRMYDENTDINLLSILGTPGEFAKAY